MRRNKLACSEDQTTLARHAVTCSSKSNLNLKINHGLVLGDKVSQSVATMSSLSPAQKWDGTMALIGGFSLHLTLGTLYCFGNLNTYMCSYLRRYVHPGIGYSDMIWIPALATVGQVKEYNSTLVCIDYFFDYAYRKSWKQNTVRQEVIQSMCVQ